MKLIQLAYSSLLLSILSFATEPINVDQNEVKSYTMQKYKINFDQLSEQEKTQVGNEYFQTSQIAKAIENQMKNDVDLKVITSLYSVDIWAKKFMASVNPKNDELKKIYDLQKPTTSSKYNLRNILLNDEKSADEIIEQLTKVNELAKKIEKFKELASTLSIDPAAKTTKGEIGFVETNKLDPNMQSLLANKKTGELVKINIPQIGWQVLLIEEFQEGKLATFEESKSFLIATIRQEVLKKEIEKLLENPTQITKSKQK